MKRGIELPTYQQIHDKYMAGEEWTAIEVLVNESGYRVVHKHLLEALQEAYSQGYEDARPKWLPVSEAVMCTEYLVIKSNGELDVAYLDECGDWYCSSEGGRYPIDRPRHFQELPPPPTR